MLSFRRTSGRFSRLLAAAALLALAAGPAQAMPRPAAEYPVIARLPSAGELAFAEAKANGVWADVTDRCTAEALRLSQLRGPAAWPSVCACERDASPVLVLGTPDLTLDI